MKQKPGVFANWNENKYFIYFILYFLLENILRVGGQRTTAKVVSRVKQNAVTNNKGSKVCKMNIHGE